VGLGRSAQRVDVPQSRKILAEILAGVPEDEQAKLAAGNTARVYNFDVVRLTAPA
jgi:predicted TIM-barrel fold metal-dependent hydrolase